MMLAKSTGVLESSADVADFSIARLTCDHHVLSAAAAQAISADAIEA